MRKILFGLTVVAVCGGLLWAGVAVAELDPVVKCQADKVKAGGKLAQCLANEQAKELKGKPFDTQKCEDKYYKAIAEADEEAAEEGAACGFVEPLCQTDMTQAQASLATCNTDLGMCNTDLAAWEASAFVPQTGQTTTFAAGDDGEVQAGVAPPVPHFTDNFDGTFTDNRSGLTWLENANCPNVSRTWQQALDDVAELNASGMMNRAGTGGNCGDTGLQTDWRLPNVLELISLLNFKNANGQPDGDPFMGTLVSSGYWSSTTFAFNPDSAWKVFFSAGINLGSSKGSNGFVVAVRGGL